MNPKDKWYYAQQQQGQDQAKKQFLMGLLEQVYKQQWENQSQDIYNNMAQAQAANALAGQQYNIMGDDYNQQLRVGSMQGDIAAQQRNVNQAARQAQQYLQQAQYGQSVSEIPSFAERGKRLLSGAY